MDIGRGCLEAVCKCHSDPSLHSLRMKSKFLSVVIDARYYVCGELALRQAQGERNQEVAYGELAEPQVRASGQ